MLITATGSLPGTDFPGSLRALTEHLPELLPLPELPARGPASHLIGRTLGLIDGLGFDVQPSGWRLAHHSGRDQRRAAAQWRHDLDDAEEILQGFTGRLKVAVAGPWTLSAAVDRPRGDRLLADPGARRDLTQALAAAGESLLSELGRRLPAATVVLQVDEPSLVAVASGSVSTASGFSRHRAVDEAELAGALHELSRLTPEHVLHVCAPGAWLPLARRAGFTTVALDAALHTSPAARDQVGTWLSEVGDIHLGVVDTAASQPQGTDQLVDAALGFLRPLELEPGLLRERCVLGTACGMASWRPPQVIEQLRALRAAAPLVAEHLQR